MEISYDDLKQIRKIIELIMLEFRAEVRQPYIKIQLEIVKNLIRENFRKKLIS